MAIRARDLVSRVRDAAVQLRFMSPWFEDRRFEKRGGRLLYAVDADVFTVYGAPHQRAGLELGRVFFDDDADLSAALAQRLTDHIFFRLTPAKPLLIAPPMQEDIASVLHGLFSKFGSEPPSLDIDFAKLQKNVEQLRTIGIAPSDHNSIYNLILKFVYLQTGSAATYRALARLVALDRIAGPEAVIRYYADVPTLARVLQPFRKLHDIFDHIKLRETWSKRLTEHRKLGERRRENLERDADCIARIDIWNRQLEKSNIRILYITGAPSIHEAVLRNSPEGSFIRHPRYFLANESLFREFQRVDLPSSESGFFGWLQTFVGSISNAARFDSDRPFDLNSSYLEAVVRAEDQNIRSSLEMQDRWRDFTREFREAYRPPDRVQDQIISDVSNQLSGIKTLTEWNKLRDQLDAQIQDITAKAWDDCFFIATRTGFAVRSETTGRATTPARTVPPIYFDSWPKTRAFIRKLSRWHEPGDFERDVYERGVNDVRSDDPSGYAYYLAHAALFSGRGEWRTAAALCDHAITVAPGLGKKIDTQANGREAHYLGGYSRRHTVRDPNELDALYAYVRRAKEIYREEQKKRPGLDAIGERFDSEELSIDLTRLMFERYTRPLEDLRTDFVKSAEELLSKILALKIRVADRIVDLCDKNKDHEMLRRCETAKQLFARISVNIISLSLTSFGSRSAERPEFVEAFSYLREYVNSGDEDGLEMKKSFFIRSALITAEALLKAANIRKRNIEEHFIGSQSALIFPYDRARFAHWSQIALSAM